MLMKKLRNKLNDVVSFTGKKIFDALKGAKEMGVDIGQMLDDTDDYNVFMENLFKFYNDFKGGEN